MKEKKVMQRKYVRNGKTHTYIVILKLCLLFRSYIKTKNLTIIDNVIHYISETPKLFLMRSTQPRWAERQYPECTN